jgi:hypothetical protein
MGENLFQNLSVVNIEEYFSLDNSRAEFAGVGARRVKLWYSTAHPPQHPRYGEPDPTYPGSPGEEGAEEAASNFK